ncbi:MAG TPA: prolipoprotein diacylglyceryl transferase [Lachnospiraceae bacterium]|nr:prolipoprotein diacylglyceryl transferase [Lachnospiraceae bacterium]
MTPEVWFPNLGIKITHMSRVAFSLFGFDVYKYGLIIGSAIMLGVLLMINEAKRTGQNPDEYLDFSIYVIIFSIIGARLYYVIFSWKDYSDNLIKIFAIREGGLAIYGAVLTGIIFSAIYARKKKKDFWLIADTVLPSVLLGQICGRWGNFFNREAFGGYTDGLFAMRYLRAQVMESNLSADIISHIINVNGVEYIQVHPTFLYESLWNLVLFIGLILLRKYGKKFNGQIGALYIIGYGSGRIWIEGLRTDQLILGNTGLAVSQLVSGMLIVTGIAIYIWKMNKRKEI